MTYKVISPAVTVLKNTEAVRREMSKGLRKDEVLSDILPEAWIQGIWTNIVVEKNQILDNSAGLFEPERLRALAEINCLEKLENTSNSKTDK